PVSNLLPQTQVTLTRSRSAEDYREVLASNVEEFERLSRMIADMLFIAKADDGQIIPSRETLDLAPLIAALAEFHRLVADEKGVTVECSGSGVINGDPLMIRRAISNLLSNAIRHAPSGGQVSVVVKTQPGATLAIEVSNSGETIAATHLPRLFDRFYRADPSRSGEGSHSGLGLAIVKSIVEAHGGKVKVTSDAGVTCFSLTF
ncbi:MAG: GHKL domain-containing protein, partial [Deltaproteobacteria bacterium]|nr:GHKL domain-containing protein [Deltaproteobacteria bacterium]